MAETLAAPEVRAERATYYIINGLYYVKTTAKDAKANRGIRAVNKNGNPGWYKPMVVPAGNPLTVSVSDVASEPAPPPPPQLPDLPPPPPAEEVAGVDPYT